MIEKHYAILYPLLNAISPLSEELWESAKGYFKLKVLKQGEHLFRVEEAVEDFYFLIDGLARYYYLTENGKEFNKSFAEKPGHLLSSISAVSKGETSPFSVEVLSDFTALAITYKDFLDLGKQNEAWNRLHLRMFENLIIKKERREADFLLLSATQRYEKFLKEYAMIANVVPNYHIASYLGITEVALSRIRKKMKLT